MEAMEKPRHELAKVINEKRVSRALRNNIRAAGTKDIKIGMDILVYREDPKTWDCPFQVLDVSGKAVHASVNGCSVQFSIDKVKEYRRARVGAEIEEEDLTTPETQEQQVKVMSFIDKLDQIMGEHVIQQTDEIFNGTSPFEFSEFATKVIQKDDPLYNSEMFEDARVAEVKGLLSRGVFQSVDKTNLPTGSNVFTRLFELTLKHLNTESEKAKARYVAQGHRDMNKRLFMHNAPSLNHRSVRVIASFSAIKGYDLFSYDVSQAYLQSDSNMSRDICLNPKDSDGKYF